MNVILLVLVILGIHARLGWAADAGDSNSSTNRGRRRLNKNAKYVSGKGKGKGKGHTKGASFNPYNKTTKVAKAGFGGCICDNGMRDFSAKYNGSRPVTITARNKKNEAQIFLVASNGRNPSTSSTVNSGDVVTIILPSKATYTDVFFNGQAISAIDGSHVGRGTGVHTSCSQQIVNVSYKVGGPIHNPYDDSRLQVLSYNDGNGEHCNSQMMLNPPITAPRPVRMYQVPPMPPAPPAPPVTLVRPAQPPPPRPLPQYFPPPPRPPPYYHPPPRPLPQYFPPPPRPPPYYPPLRPQPPPPPPVRPLPDTKKISLKPRRPDLVQFVDGRFPGFVAPTAQPTITAPLLFAGGDFPGREKMARPTQRPTTEAPSSTPTYLPSKQSLSCVECSDIRSEWMVLNNESCETYDWAFEKLCANEGSGWLNSETKFCQYSCWSNGVGYSDYSPCCAIDDEETDLLVAGGQFKMPPRPPQPPPPPTPSPSPRPTPRPTDGCEFASNEGISDRFEIIRSDNPCRKLKMGQLDDSFSNDSKTAARDGKETFYASTLERRQLVASSE